MPSQRAPIHKIAVKTYNLKELSALYRVSRKTMRRWLKRLGFKFPRERQLFTPKEVRYIFEKLGEP